MANNDKTTITVEATVQAPLKTVWEYWNAPEHITKWCAASEDWHAPRAENDLRAGGKFVTRMEARDGSFGFEFGGTYDDVKTYELISYTMDDGRTTQIIFTDLDGNTHVSESFIAEETNPIEMQEAGWQVILNNFKKYVEENS